MPEIGTSGSTSGDGKRRVAAWPKRPRPSSTLPRGQGLPSVSVAAIGLVLLTLVGAAGPALGEPRKNEEKANEVDTEHMFGFITGTDIGQVGDKELESETTGRLGKRTGSYTKTEEQ